PPKRDVEHEIPYKDESDPPRPRRVYKVPAKHMKAWRDLVDKHVNGGIWIPTTARNADPMMPVVKSDGVSLRPTVDLRARNANTIRMTMPHMDAKLIRETLAKHRFHLQLDIKGAFQQLLTALRDQFKQAFSTIDGIFYTRTAQQG
ncbi:DNA/RNA polymerase, partial [Meredithblackwellia eburnea MCA 4105]